MSMPLVSVIVPVYNTSEFVSRCIESILQQTYVHFELIVVDDGSTDSSAEICDSYQTKDERVHVYHTSNHGLPAARKYGIERATGKYIQHVDSDDWVAPDMLETLVTKAETDNLDIVVCNFIWELPDESRQICLPYNSKDDYTREVISGKWGTIWRVFALRSLYDNKDFYFPVGITGGEDYVVVTQLLYWSHDVGFSDDCFYHYNSTNASSYLANPSLHRTFEQIKNTCIVEAFLEEHKIKQDYASELISRKIWAKAPLAKNEWDLWLQVFPEVNDLVIRTQKGKRAWLRRLLRRLADKL